MNTCKNILSTPKWNVTLIMEFISPGYFRTGFERQQIVRDGLYSMRNTATLNRKASDLTKVLMALQGLATAFCNSSSSSLHSSHTGLLVYTSHRTIFSL